MVEALVLGVIVTCCRKDPRPMVWFVPPEAGVLYSVNQSTYSLLRTPWKKVAIEGDDVLATCERYPPLPQSTWMTCAFEITRPP
jgi:hypothetical protein